MQITKLLNSFLPFLGLIDSMYLMRIRSNPGVCEVEETSFAFNLDCGAVAVSEYSTIIGVPLALIGIFYYVILIVLLTSDLAKVRNLGGKEFTVLHISMVVLSMGFMISLYLVYLQLFVIQSICVYCMVSAIVTTILFFNILRLITNNI